MTTYLIVRIAAFALLFMVAFAVQTWRRHGWRVRRWLRRQRQAAARRRDPRTDVQIFADAFRGQQ